MQRILMIPGAVTSPNPITLPVDCPDIDVIINSDTGVQAVIATKITKRTFSLNVNTKSGDTVMIAYQEVGILSHP